MSYLHTGMGNLGEGSRGIVLGGSAVATVGGLMAAIPAIAAATGPFAPIAIAVGSLVAFLGGMVGGGCGQTCVVASQNTNQIEDAMKANLAAFRAGQIDQSTALATFDSLWQQQASMCQQVGGPRAGQCVSDRQAGACTWKDATGVCWNWFSGYRDPIANSVPSGSYGTAGSGSTPSPWLPLMAVGLIAAGVML